MLPQKFNSTRSGDLQVATSGSVWWVAARSAPQEIIYVKKGMIRLLISLWLLLFFLADPGGKVRGEEESSIPVRFLQNKEISLDLYPSGFQSAVVLTGTGIDGGKDLYPLKRLVFLLANQGVRGTVFVSVGDTFRKKIAQNQHWVKLLAELSSNDFEIAQNGSFVSGRVGSKKIFEADPVGAPLPPPPGIDKIKAGREFLISLGLEPEGYRGYNLSAADPIIPLLDKMGYLYYCCGSASGPAARTAPEPDTENIYMYPEHTSGLRILKFIERFDPTIDLKKARQLSGEISRKSGVFICNIYLPDLIEEAKLNELRQFITYLKEKNTWICSLRELSAWWNVREKVEIKASWNDNTLIMVYDNPTKVLLKNARLNFKALESPARYYRVEDRNGVMASQGIIPDSRSINVTLFPAQPGS